MVRRVDNAIQNLILFHLQKNFIETSYEKSSIN